MQTRILIILFALSVPLTAHAYIDPGTGSIIIQGLVATIAAIGVTLRVYWHKIGQFFGRGKKNDGTD